MDLELSVDQRREDETGTVTQPDRAREEDGLEVFGVARGPRRAHHLTTPLITGDHRITAAYLLSHQAIQYG